MTKISNALMALVGSLGAAGYLAALFFSGVLGELTSLPILLMIAVGAAGLSALLIFFTPAYALVAGGGPKKPKAKKSKKGKDAKAADLSEGDEDFADDDFADDVDAFDSSTAADDSMAEDYADSYDSVAASDADFFGSDEFAGGGATESSVAHMLDNDGSSTGSDADPFDISDSFESDIKEIDTALNDSEAFDDQFELSPESGIDFDVDDEEEKA